MNIKTKEEKIYKRFTEKELRTLVAREKIKLEPEDMAKKQIIKILLSNYKEDYDFLVLQTKIANNLKLTAKEQEYSNGKPSEEKLEEKPEEELEEEINEEEKTDIEEASEEDIEEEVEIEEEEKENEEASEENEKSSKKKKKKKK